MVRRFSPYLAALSLVMKAGLALAQQGGCEVTMPGSFRLLERQAPRSGGPSYPAQTRVRVFAYGSATQGPQRAVRVRIDTAEGWLFLWPSQLRGCPAGSIARRPGDVSTEAAAPPPTAPPPNYVCVPGATQVCPCVGGGSGVQACSAAGSSFEPCVCAAAAGPTQPSNQGRREEPDPTPTQVRNLSGENLSSADFSGQDLSRANLSNTSLSHANLRGTRLRGANLRYANLRNADVSGADLSGADLSNADLVGVVCDSLTIWPATVSVPNCR